MTNQLYLDSAWGKVHKERRYLLYDQLIHLEKQTNCGGLEPFVGAEEEKAAFKAKYTVKIVCLSLSPWLAQLGYCWRSRVKQGDDNNVISSYGKERGRENCCEALGGFLGGRDRKKDCNMLLKQ